MNIELFNKTYVGRMVEILDEYAAKLIIQIKEDIECPNYHVTKMASYKVELLSEIKMISNTYKTREKETAE